MTIKEPWEHLEVGDIVRQGRKGELAQVIRITHLPSKYSKGAGPTVAELKWYRPDLTPQEQEALREEEVRQTRAEIIRWACNVRDGLLAKAELADRLAAGSAPQGERP